MGDHLRSWKSWVMKERPTFRQETLWNWICLRISWRIAAGSTHLCCHAIGVFSVKATLTKQYYDSRSISVSYRSLFFWFHSLCIDYTRTYVCVILAYTDVGFLRRNIHFPRPQKTFSTREVFAVFPRQHILSPFCANDIRNIHHCQLFSFRRFCRQLCIIAVASFCLPDVFKTLKMICNGRTSWIHDRLCTTPT